MAKTERLTHTPGPWTLKVVVEEGNASHSMPWGVVHRPGTHSIETNLYDARLIAAAPDLLAALEQALVAAPWDCEYSARCGTDDYLCAQCAARDAARAAIRKAKGE